MLPPLPRAAIKVLVQTYGESVRQERACYPTAGNTTCKDLYLNKGRDRHAEQGFYIADIERCAGRGRELRLAQRELPRADVAEAPWSAAEWAVALLFVKLLQAQPGRQAR